MPVHKENIFIRNKQRDDLLLSFFGSGAFCDKNILSLEKSGIFSKSRYIATSFVYFAETNNHRLVKMGVTESPDTRLGYSRDYFGVSLSYIAIFCGGIDLESFLLKSFVELRTQVVNNKSAKEWFLNKGKLNLFCNQLRASYKSDIFSINLD